jgi:hypothetical protein
MVISTSRAELVTWRTVVLLLPFEAAGEEFLVAGLLVNPALEEVWLARDRNTWHPSSIQDCRRRAGIPGTAGYLSEFRPRGSPG